MLEQLHYFGQKKLDMFKNSVYYYLGQTVSLIKGKEADYLKTFIIDNFTNHYTNMGYLLVGITGSIVYVTQSEVTYKSNDMEVTVSTYKPLYLSFGTNVTLYYMSYNKDEQTSLVMIFDEDTNLILTVTAISRGKSGEMLLNMTDVDDEEHEISASGCILEVNLTKISVDDELVVYHESIMEN